MKHLAALFILSVLASAQQTVSHGPLSGDCYPSTTGIDIVNNVLYSCGGSPPQWVKVGGSSAGVNYVAPSGDTSGATDGNTITNACVAGSTILLAPTSVGTYYIGKSNSNNITVGAACSIKGAGPGPTVIQSEDTTGDWITVNFNNVANDATPPTPMPSGCLIDGITLIADTNNTVTAGAGLRVGTNGTGYTYGCTFSHLDIKGAYYNVRQDPGFWMNTFEDMQLSEATSGDCVYFDTPSPGGDATWLNVRMIGASAGSPCNFYVNNSDTNIISHLKFNNGKFVFSSNGMSNTFMFANNVEGAASCAYDFSAGSSYGIMVIDGGEFELTGAAPDLFNPVCGAANVKSLRVTSVCAGNVANAQGKCGDYPRSGYQDYDDLIGPNVNLNTVETNDLHPWVRTFSSVWTSLLMLANSGTLQTVGANPTISVYYINNAPLTPNYTVTANCTDPGSGAGWCLIGSRLTSPAAGTLAGYGCLFVQGTGVVLDKFSGSTPTVTALGSTDTTFTSGTHTIGISAAQSKISCIIDGITSSTATATDSTYATAGFPWIGVNQGSGSGYTINYPITVQ